MEGRDKGRKEKDKGRGKERWRKERVKRAKEDRSRVEKIRKGGNMEEEKDGKNIGRKDGRKKDGE